MPIVQVDMLEGRSFEQKKSYGRKDYSSRSRNRKMRTGGRNCFNPRIA